MRSVFLTLALIALIGGCTAEMISCNGEELKATCDRLTADGAIITLDICEWNTTTGKVVDYIFYDLPK